MKNNCEKRKVELLIVSDIHLGTYGCHAKELLHYLSSIDPEKIILNGDIIDIWQFNKRYWPKSHMQVLYHIINWIIEGKDVVYITGNHDEMLRKFKGTRLNNFSLLNKLVIEFPDNKKAWIFHGDVFDVTMKHSKWIAKLGGKGYDILILLNRFINWISKSLGRGKISLSKKIKNSVKSAVKFINNFEETAVGIAAEKNYDYVICGHIHQPEIRKIKVPNGHVMYLNSGDWIENLTSLEYNKGKWRIFKYEDEFGVNSVETKNELSELENEFKLLDNNVLFENLLEEFNIIPHKKVN